MPLTKEVRSKIARFCNVEIDSVIEARDAETIYDVPLLMLKEKLDKTVLKKLKLKIKTKPELGAWKEFLGRLKNPTQEVNIGLVGKYIELPDAYKSIHEAFIHGSTENECKVNIIPIHSESLEHESVENRFKNLDGVLVAPGFGSRGVKGKIQAIKYIRENKIPFFGICLGMQCAVVEYAKNVLGLKAASVEVNPKTEHPVIHLMDDQKNVENKGGTMRLGSFKCSLIKGSLAYQAYHKASINERHRHRYEFNNAYKAKLEKAGMICTGVNPEGNLVEIVELADHPFFIGVQFHPELKSRVEKPHPLFVSFIKAAKEYHINKQL
jgi:CTP synthase